MISKRQLTSALPEFGIRLLSSACAVLLTASALAQNAPVTLQVDATDAPRKILHARLVIPTQPGKLMLVYPKWIPGEHGPTGPVSDLVGLEMRVAGKPVAWQRDPEDMYAFHVGVPQGANAVEVKLDFLLPTGGGGSSQGTSATAQLVDINWNQLLLYPKGGKPSELQFAVNLRLPGEWKSGTTLPVARESADGIEFSPVSLETLVDSPLIAGAHFRTVDLTPGAATSHLLHIVADSDTALEMKPEYGVRFSRLVAEAEALFGCHHYRSYHFLLTLSDHVSFFGLEHHESSDNRTGELFLIDEDVLKQSASLLPHEMTHSWNGKYRRPVGLATTDFQQPMQGELLWVYEGLTDYLGNVLTTRSGLWTNTSFQERLALVAASLDNQAGRTWRSLADTAVAAQMLYGTRPEGAAWRRGVDFYSEGDLIWLEADVIIRQRTQGRRSVDDFCRRFHGGGNGPPKVVPYTYDDVVAGLNEVAPYDWRQFFQTRVYATNPRAPLAGIEGSGWKLAYTNAPTDMLKSRESSRKLTDMSCSLGVTIREDGGIVDVIPGSPADKGGIGSHMKLVAVNGRRWTPAILRAAVKSARTDSAPIEVLVENEDYFKTCKLDYHDGEKYPCLERDASKPDLLTEILKPLTPSPPEGGEKR